MGDAPASFLAANVTGSARLQANMTFGLNVPPWDYVNTMHAAEVPLVTGIQSATPHWLEEFLQVYTESIHPSMALSVAAPALFALGRRGLGFHLVLVVAASDLFNTVLKWALAGDRPYWASSMVKQFPMTCEGGYGMPSGHVQAFATSTYFLLARVQAGARVLAMHAGLVVAGAYSRVYTGSHFPSQTLAGWVVGAACGFGGHGLLASPRAASWLGQRAPATRRAATLACFTAACGVVVAAVYLGLGALGRDPLASLARARQACRSERGVVGLVFEGAAGCFGALFGTAAASSIWPLADGKERTSPLTCALAAAGVLVHWGVLVALKHAAGAYKDGPDGPFSLTIAAALGFATVVLAASLSMIVPFAERSVAKRVLCNAAE